MKGRFLLILIYLTGVLIFMNQKNSNLPSLDDSFILNASELINPSVSSVLIFSSGISSGTSSSDLIIRTGASFLFTLARAGFCVGLNASGLCMPLGTGLLLVFALL